MNNSTNEPRTPWSDLTRANWVLIIASACLICVLSLGVHDVMLTKLKIPYASVAAVPTWAKYADITIRIASLVWLASIAHQVLGRTTWMRASALLGLCLMFLNETLRGFCIDISLTRGWQHGFWLFFLADRLPSALIWFLYGAGAAIIARWISRKNSPVIAKVAIVVGGVAALVAVGMFALQPMLEGFAVHVERFLRLADPVQIYFEPYPTQVDWVIYGTFIEATFAAFVLVGLVWRGLNGASSYRVCKYAGLLLLVRGRMVSLLLFSFWVHGPRGLAFLSESQFFLEPLLLAILWGVIWARIERTRPLLRRLA